MPRPRSVEEFKESKLKFKFPYYIRVIFRDLVVELCKYDPKLREVIESDNSDEYTLSISIEDMNYLYPLKRQTKLRYKAVVNYFKNYLNINLVLITRVHKPEEAINLIEIKR